MNFGLLGRAQEDGGCTGALPEIETPPRSISVLTGNPFALTVDTTEPNEFNSYQWHKGSEAIVAANGQTFVVLNSQLPHSGDYRVVISNDCGSVTSRVAHVRVLPSPTRGLLPQNIAPNPTFELDGDLDGRPDSWNKGESLGTVCLWTTNSWLTTAHSLHIQDDTPENWCEWYSDPIPVEGGMNYLFRFSWRYSIGQGPFRVSLGYLLSDLTFLDGDHILANGAHMNWEEINRRVTIPPNASFVYITVTSGGPSSAVGAMWVDNLSFAQEPACVHQAVEGNILPNPSFEQDLDGDLIPDFWNRSGPATACLWDTQQFASGSHSLKVSDGDPNTYYEWYSQHVPVQPGGIYFLRFWRRYDVGGAVGRVSVGYRTLGATAGSLHFRFSGTQLAWKEVNARLVVPEAANSLLLTLTSGDNLQGEMWLDNIRLSRAPAVPFNEVELVSLTNSWRYHQTSNLDGVEWQSPNYDDSLWPAGRGLLYSETNTQVGPRNTPLDLGATTYYFRTEFIYAGQTSRAVLALNCLVDDGVVYYLNGVELARLRMSPGGIIQYGSYASSTPPDGDALVLDTVSGLSITNLLHGTNTLAAEVHQVSGTSSDVVFGCALVLSQLEIPPMLELEKQNPLSLILHAETDRSYGIESSLDLKNWNLYGTVFPVETSTQFQPFFSPTEPSRFYRVVW